ncbi:Protein mlp1, partial [Coemansia helicoidea]
MDQALSQLLGLPAATVAAVVGRLGDPAAGDAQTVLQRIQQKLEEKDAAADGTSVQRAKAELQYENTRLENEVHRLNRAVGELRSARDGADGEAKAARDGLAAAQSRLEETQAAAQTHQQRAAALEAQVAQMRAQTEQHGEEKRALLRQLAERREELDGRATEAGRLRETAQELEHQRATDQAELAQLRSKLSVADINEHMATKSLELARSQAAWLDEELGKAQTEAQQARAEAGRAAMAGKAEATRLRGEVEALQEQVEELGGRSAQLERRLREKLEAERQAREAAAEEAEQFRREMAAQKKLCAEWERTTDAAKQHVRAVEASLRGLEEQQRTGEERAQAAVDAAEEACSAAEARAARLEAELRAANKLVSDQAQSQLLSPTAGAAARARGAQGTLSITQLYADKLALEDRLRDADAEIAGLRQSMEQILAEIEERGPILAAEREDHRRLLTDADRIAQDLAAVRQECAAKTRALDGARKEADLAQRQLAAEQQQTRDLERQVARLLRAAEETRAGGRPLADGPAAAAMHVDGDDEQWLNDVDRVITQKLVTFADVAELVAQNRRLLRTTRELASQNRADGDGSDAGSDTGSDASGDEALEQAETLLSRLSAELDRTKTRLGAAERERDMLKALGGTPRGPLLPMAPPADTPMAPADDDLAQVQADYEAYRSEARRTRAQLEGDVARLQEETSSLRVRAAKAEAQTQFDADRMQLFARDLEARQKEVDHLRVATGRLHKQTEAYEQQLAAALQEAAAGRAELARLQRQATLLEAERNAERQHEQRRHADEQ